MINRKIKNINEFNFFGEEAEFHHIGIAVKSINKVIPNAKIIEDKTQKVKVAFARINGFDIELVQPINDDSPVSGFLEKKQSIYHLCFHVKNIDKSISNAKKYGFRCIANPVPAKAFDNKKIAWLYSRVYGLVEIKEM